MAPHARLKNVASIGQMKPGGKHRRLAGIVAVAALTAGCTASPPAAQPPNAPGSAETPAAQASGSQAAAPPYSLGAGLLRERQADGITTIERAAASSPWAE